MAKDTVTLELQGSVPLDKFADAVQRFSNLVRALSAETGVPEARWDITDLSVGSAVATARGTANGSDEKVERVVSAYLEVGRALESGTTLPFSSSVSEEAFALTRVLGNGLDAIRFETAEADALVRARVPEPGAAPVATERREAYGAVTGRVQTLTSRSRLRFVLYDSLHDKAVSCYLVEGDEDKARGIWDKLATVEGWVSRDPLTDRPIAVRRIAHITIVDEGDPDGYLKARGAMPRGTRDRAEIRIRRVRDAW